MDIGCYNVDLSRMLLGGEPTAVSAAITRDPASGVDVLTSAILEFGERTATFTVATRTEDDQRVHLVGTEGRISLEIPFNIPPDVPTRVFFWEGHGDPGALPAETFAFAPADQYTLQAEAFAATVLDGAPPHLSLDDSIANMEAIESIFAAAG